MTGMSVGARMRYQAVEGGSGGDAALGASLREVELLVEQVVGWIGQLTLWAALASILLGAAVWGLSNSTGNGDGSRQGRRLLTAGMTGALLVSIAPSLVNAFQQ